MAPHDDPRFIPVHESLEAIRNEKGKTQKEIADALGIDPAQYHRIKKGERRLLAEEARVAAAFLHVPITALFRRKKQDSRPTAA